jgi:ribosomal protein S26
MALRYRRQLQTALYVWRMFKKMRRMNDTKEKQIEKKETTGDVQLIRCAKCGTWIPQKNALKLRSKTFFCSANCMEKAVEVN